MTNEEEKPKEQNSSFCIFVILMTEVPIGFLFGTNLSALNSSTPAITVFINDTYSSRYGEYPNSSTVTLILTLAQSLLIWGSLVGSILAKPVLGKFSRKHVLILMHVGNILSVIFMGPISYYGRTYESLIVGRFVAGVARGIAFSTFPVVVAETTCRRRLGFYQAPFSMLHFISSAVGAGLGHPKALGTPDLWMWIVCVPAISSIIYICAIPWLPETPISLLRCGKHDEAYQLLRKLRDNENIECEFALMQNELKDDSSKTSIPIMTFLRTPVLRRQLFTTIIVLNGAQFVGLQVIFMYSDAQLLSAGVSREYVTFVTMGIFFQCIIAFAVASKILKRYGTKRVYIIGLVVMSLGYIAFIVSDTLKTEAASYVSLVSFCVVVFGLQSGPLYTLFALPTELTTANSRSTVLYCSGCLFWILGGSISFIFPYSLAAWGSFAALPFAILSIAIIPFIIIVVPETHKRTAAQIQNSFRKKSLQTAIQNEHAVSI